MCTFLGIRNSKCTLNVSYKSGILLEDTAKKRKIYFSTSSEYKFMNEEHLGGQHTTYFQENENLKIK